jgi:F-type H+-transporting ATPase subunit gamma
MKLLPVDVEQLERAEEIEKGSIMNYEPSSQAVLDYIIPKYVSSVIYGGMIESAASEQGARMTAMDSATENAEEMISNLTLQYNRARQAVITNELSELVAGAEALK